MQNNIIRALIYLLIVDFIVSKTSATENPIRRKATELKTCASSNTYPDNFNYGNRSWLKDNEIKSGYLSFIEAIAGEFINFYILKRYGMTEPSVNQTSFLYNQSQSYYPYTSICELARYGNIPYEKIVVGFCTGDSCGPTCDTPSSEWLTEMIAGESSGNLLGGIAVGNVDQVYKNEKLFSYNKVILDNNNKSSFFDTIPEDTTKYLRDTPRFILNVRKFPNILVISMYNFFQELMKAGVNYVTIDDYDPISNVVEESISFYKNHCWIEEEKVCGDITNIRVLGRVKNMSEVVSKILSGDYITEYKKRIRGMLIDYSLDGIVLEFRDITELINTPNSLCVIAYLIKLISASSLRNIIVIDAEMGHLLPFVESKIMTDELKEGIWDYIQNQDYTKCYSDFVNKEGKEWVNEVVESEVFNGGSFIMPNNKKDLPTNFFKTYEKYQNDGTEETLVNSK